jgi:hypothetical protein
MRDVLSTSSSKYEALIPRGKAYIGNCVTIVASPFSLQQFLNMPLGHVAARIRKDLVQQGSREAVEASLRATRNQQQTSIPPPDADMTPANFIFTNWAKAKLFETDFSAAIISCHGNQGRPIDEPTRGKPTYIHVYGTDRRTFDLGAGQAGVGHCIGKDARGGYWLAGISSEECAQKFEQAVMKDAWTSGSL